MPSTDATWASPAMTAVLGIVQRVAPTQLSVLITGESGTGKEVVARTIHQHCTRPESPLVVVDCAAIPPTLLESELFGHTKGAFTGAISHRSGLVSMADGGTFFLDEVGEMPAEIQAKLLRLLEDGSYRPVGGTEQKTAQLRVIAATNRDLEQAVTQGRFRRDLYHRLNGCRIHLPPLRERREDIPPLLSAYLHKFAKAQGRPAPSLSSEAAHILASAPWPGNVRELVNCARYLASLVPGPVITSDDLPPMGEPLPVDEPLHSSEVAPDLSLLPYKAAKRAVLDKFEAEYIQAILARHGGNVSAAARAAGIDRRSIQRMLKRMDQD